jgi:ABC-type nitrate/sulfonate/bicarbonate transport system substrate-binding protein
MLLPLRRRAFIALLLGALLTPASQAAAADKINVGAVGSATAIYWPFFVGQAKGFFAAENLELDVVYAQSSAAIMQQLAANSVDVTIGGGLVDPIRAIDKGAPLAVVRIMVQAPPYTLVAKPSIKSIAELKGKTISIGGPKDITRIYIDGMLAPNGLKDGDYDFVFAGSTGARYSALQTGAIDATLLTAPFNFHSKAAGFSQLGEASRYMPDLPFGGLVVNRNWAAANPQILQRFLAATTKSVLYLEAPQNRAESIKAMADASRLKLDEVEASYDYFRNYFENTGNLSKATLGKLIAALQRLGDIPPSFGTDRLLMPGAAPVVD